MPNLFGVDIAGEVNEALGPGLLAVTLSEPSLSARDPSNLTAGPTVGSPTSHTTRGFIEDFSQYVIDGDRVRLGDKKVTVLGKPLGSSAPKSGWTVTIEGVTYNVVAVISRDPAAATYTLQGRLP